MYKVDVSEVVENRKTFMDKYPPFKPRTLSKEEKEYMAESFAIAVSTQNGPDFDDYNVPENSKVEQYLKNLTPGKLLLIGVGTGRETKVAQSLGFDVIGTTLGSRNIEFGKRFLGLTDQNHRELINEILPFKPNTFDYVLGCQVFEHTMTPMIFLLEQSRVLKTGGTLILEWPPGHIHQGGNNPHHQVCFTPGQAESLFQKAGFEDTKLFTLAGDLPKEDVWKNDQPYYMACKGIKSNKHNVAHYIRKYWLRDGIS